MTPLWINVPLGPLLTLIVLMAGKKSLKFDVCVIGCVQACALAYGVYTLTMGRPVFIAAVGHKLDLIQAIEIGQYQLSGSTASFLCLGPKVVGVKQATDKKERERMMFNGLAG